MNTDNTDKFRLPIVIFDSECTLCNRFKMSVEKIDKDHYFNFISLYDEEIFTTFNELNKDDCLKEVHLISPQYKIYKGPEVITYMLKSLPEVSKFAWLIESQMGQKAIKIFHNTANMLRKKLAKNCSSCSHK